MVVVVVMVVMVVVVPMTMTEPVTMESERPKESRSPTKESRPPTKEEVGPESPARAKSESSTTEWSTSHLGMHAHNVMSRSAFAGSRALRKSARGK